MQTGIDYTALFYDVTRRQLREYGRRTSTSARFRDFRPILLVVGILLTLAPVTWFFLPAELLGSRSPAVYLVFLPFFGIPAIKMSRGTRSREVESRFRYEAFARVNGLTYWPEGRGANYPGPLFAQVPGARFSDTIRSATGDELDRGNFESGSSDRRGYMAIRLGRKLPHMVLDSHENGNLFLPGYVPRDQVLSLEGDFDKHFTLYCPRAYESDALYIFTPDLMVLLIDQATPFDVEIIDDWMFVHSSEPFTATDPAVYHRLFQIVATVGKKALSQSARYSDERAGEFSLNSVATPGQRLKVNRHIGLIVFLVLIFIAYVAIFISAVVIDSRYP